MLQENGDLGPPGVFAPEAGLDLVGLELLRVVRAVELDDGLPSGPVLCGERRAASAVRASRSPSRSRSAGPGPACGSPSTCTETSCPPCCTCPPSSPSPSGSSPARSAFNSSFMASSVTASPLRDRRRRARCSNRSASLEPLRRGALPPVRAVRRDGRAPHGGARLSLEPVFGRISGRRRSSLARGPRAHPARRPEPAATGAAGRRR